MSNVERTVLVIGPAIEYRNYVARKIAAYRAQGGKGPIDAESGRCVVGGVEYVQTFTTSAITGRDRTRTTYAYVGNVGSKTETILLACGDQYESEARA